MKYPDEESSTLEFKETLPQNDQIIKTVVGFCNQNGGKIIIGVQNDGTIKGLNEDEVQKVLEYLDKSIYDRTSPPIIPLVYAQTIADKTLLIIEVSAGMNKPYYIRAETLERGTYVRLGRSTLRANADTIEELKWASRGRSYDLMPVYHAKMEDLDYAKIEQFFLSRKGSKNVPQAFNEALAAYNIITDAHAHTLPTVAGILLFGKNPEQFISEAFIICTRFQGIEGREALAAFDCTGTLFTQYKEAYAFVVSQLNRSFTIKGPKRLEKLEVPEEAIREAIINAIIHRNYHIKAPIKISIFDNRIEIFSPGSFPGPINKQNLKMGLTYMRNQAITKIFREAGYSEKLGSGFRTIFASYADYGLPEPEIHEGANFVKCVLPRDHRRTIGKHTKQDERRILDLFEQVTELSIGEIIELLHIPRSTVHRQLQRLIKDGVLAKKGTGSGTKYLRNF